MSEHVIPVLRSKRAEISGQILEQEKRITQLRADLANLDAAIRLLSPSMDPGTIPPKRAYKRTQYFARNELSRMALDIMRKAQGPLAAREIAVAIMKAKGLAMGDDRLCVTVTDMLLVALRSLTKRQAVIKTGASRDVRWTLVTQNP